MNRNICNKTILKAVSVSIFAVLFYMACDDNGVKVVTPEVTTFVDYRDNRTYKKVQIGSQIWMAENLKYEAENSQCDDITWSPYDDPAQNCEEYGRLYDWNTAMDGVASSSSVPSGVEGVCPVGWHLPSDAEWTILTDFVGENAGTKLKSRDFSGAIDLGTPSGTDKYRFSALPLPSAWISYWWSSTELVTDEGRAWYRAVWNRRVDVMRWYDDKHAHFYAVRCVKD